jgi:hypothetical protein
MRGGVRRCLTHAYERARVRGADGTALRFVCASTVPSPHSHGLAHTDGSVLVYSTCTHPAVYADRRTRVSPRRTCDTSAPRRACARSCVCAGVTASAPTRASTSRRRRASRESARRRSPRRRPSTRTSARGTPRESRGFPRYAPLLARRAPRRTALGRSPTHARPLCAAAPPMSLCVRARECSYAYKGLCGMIAVGCTPVLECHRALSASKLIDVQRTHASNFSTLYVHIDPYRRLHRARQCVWVWVWVCVCVFVCVLSPRVYLARRP